MSIVHSVVFVTVVVEVRIKKDIKTNILNLIYFLVKRTIGQLGFKVGVEI